MNVACWLRHTLLTLALVAMGGCSVSKIAVDKAGDALSQGTSAFATDDDPELIAAAAPFSLKLMESVLAENPNHDVTDVHQQLYGILGDLKDRVLAEAFRVLKPGGRFLFLEHGLAPDAGVARWQRRLDPLQRRIAGGCHLSRDTVALVHQSGLQLLDAEHYYLRGVPRFGGYMTEGSALKS